MTANISPMKLDTKSGRDFKLWKELDEDLHPERGPGCHWIPIIRHGERTEGEAAAGNVEFGSVTIFAPVREAALGEGGLTQGRGHWLNVGKNCRIRISQQHGAHARPGYKLLAFEAFRQSLATLGRDAQ